MHDLLARIALAARVATRGRTVSMDAVAEPTERPAYPRYISMYGKAHVAPYPFLRGVRPLTPPELRAEAAQLRARVARTRCAQRELMLAAKRAARKASR